MNKDLISYYKERAKEYEKIYNKPERQKDLEVSGGIFQDVFSDKDVLEIACGTGYWTERISKTARSVLATDINEAVIEIAKSKKYFQAKVEFTIEDIFNFKNVGKHENLFAGFIWSHIKLQDLPAFIDIIIGLVKSGGTIVFMDNNYIEGSNLPVTETDEFGNTFQERKLENRTTHKILKNFPTKHFILQLLADKVSDINFTNLQYYWILQFKVG